MRLDALANGIGRLVGWVAIRPLRVVVMFVLLTAGSGYYTATQLGINTDTADMISRDLPWRQDFIAFRDQFPNRFRTIIVVIDGTQAAVDRAARRLSETLKQRPDLFLDVYQPLGGDYLERNGLLYLPLPELEQLADRLATAQPLIGRLSEDASGANLLATLADFIRRDADAVNQLAPLLEPLAQVVEDHAGGDSSHLDWGGLVSAAASPRQILVVQPALDFSKARPARAAMEFLQALKVEAADVELRLTGSVAMEHEELDSVVRGASLAGLLALLMVTVVLYIALRSVLLLCVSLVTLVVGLTLTAAFAALAVGHLNLISVAFAVLYIGLGIDFIIHSILRFQELRGDAMAAGEALPVAARGVGLSLVICAITTAAGFYAFIPTPFEGVSELGLISGTGMFLSLAVSLTLLPALLKLAAPFLAVPAQPAAPVGAAVARPLPRRWVLGTAGLVTTLGLIALGGVRFDNDPLHLREAETESVVAFNALLEDERIAPRTLTVLADSEAAAASLAVALQALPEVKRAVTTATLVPEAQADKLFVLEDLQLLLGPRIGTSRALPHDTARFAEALSNLADVVKQLAPRHPLVPALAAFARQADSLAAPGGAAAQASLAENLMVDFEPALGRLERALSAELVHRENLPEALVARFVLGDGRTLVEVHPAADLSDNRAASTFIDAVWRIAPRATGRPVVNREGGATVVRSFQLAFAYALAIVACLVWLFLGRFSDAVLVLVPVLMVSIVTAALAVLFNQPFNFANIIALPLLLGVGVDNGIHMVHRWRSEPPVAKRLTQVSTGRAVLFSGLTTVASFGNLAFSPHPGMASMGWILSVGMLVTLLATLVLLPSLLEGHRR